MRERWTKREDDILIDLWKKGVTIAAIGLHIDRGKRAIIARRRYLLLPARRESMTSYSLRVNVTREQQEKIRKRADEKGWTVAHYMRWLIKQHTG